MKQENNSYRKTTIPNFNSIKVRLKLKICCSIRRFDAPFQFHKGTIETQGNNHLSRTSYQFQFHKGTIETRLLQPSRAISAYFNSIKVRLKQQETSLDEILQAHFNSIKVRLKHAARSELIGIVNYFNSIKVRLKLENFKLSTVAATLFQFHKGTIETKNRHHGTRKMYISIP